MSVRPHLQLFRLVALLGLGSLHTLCAEPIPVRHLQGTQHGFLTLRSLDGKLLANGELTQSAHADRVTNHIVFRFKDGSLDDQTTVFLQRNTFQLVSNHHIQHGPSFPDPIDTLIEGGKVTNRSTDKEGHEKIDSVAFDTPPDTANGLPLTILLNLPPTAAETKVSYIAPGKPRLVHLSIKPAGDLAFSGGGVRHKATEFVIHVEIGGVAGAVAPIFGKEPKDIHVWVLGGEAPAFIREEGQLYLGGPIWRIDLATPAFTP